jgi:hypothetical protein
MALSPSWRAVSSVDSIGLAAAVLSCVSNDAGRETGAAVSITAATVDVVTLVVVELDVADKKAGVEAPTPPPHTTTL